MDLKNPPQGTDYPQKYPEMSADMPNSSPPPPPPPVGKKLNLPTAAWLAFVRAGTHSLAKL